MKRIYALLAILAIYTSATAQITSSTALSTGITSYTNGMPNDPMFFYCSGQLGSLTATPTSGVAGWNFIWESFNPTLSTWQALSTENGVPFSTVNNLQPGGYRCTVIDGNAQQVGRHIGWIIRVNTLPVLNVNPIAPGCGNVNLSGNWTAGTATPYYNIPPEPDPNSQIIIDANTEISVCFTGLHTQVSNMAFRLVAPAACGGASITLATAEGTCNSGDNFTNLCFSTESSVNYDVCTAPTPLTGSYGSYGGSSTPINWTPLYGCLANQTGWRMYVLDCVSQNFGTLQSVSITFTGTSVGGSTATLNYTGTLANQQILNGNSFAGGFILDNVCNTTTAANYLVTNVAPPINLTQGYAWSANPPIAIPNPTGSATGNIAAQVISPGPIADTQFTLSLTGNFPVGICGFSGSDTELYDYTNAAVPVIAPVAPNYCIGGPPVQLTANLTGGTWVGPGTNSSGQFNPTTAGVGTHTISYTLAGSCVTTVTTTVQVWPTANVSITDPGDLCEGQGIVTLAASTPGGVWSGTGIVNTATGTFDPAIAGAGSTTVTYSVPNVCSGTDNQTITVLSSPVLAITDVDPVCSNASSFNLAANEPGGTWSGSGITNAATGLYNPSTVAPGSYTVTYQLNNACVAPATTTVEVWPTLNVSIADPGILCPSNGIVTLSASAPGGSWTGEGILSASNGTFNTPGLAEGSYTITYTVPNSCQGTDTQEVTIGEEPSITLTPINTTICSEDAPFGLTANVSGGTWSGPGITNVNAGTFTPASANLGNNVVTYTYNTGCPVSESLTLNVLQSANATITAPSEVCDNATPFSLTVAQTGGVWTGTGVNSSGVFNPSAVGFGSTTLTYTLAGACGDSDTHDIVVISVSALDISPVGPFCVGDAPVQMTTNIPGGTWSGNGISSSGLFTPSTSNVGSLNVQYNLAGDCPAVEVESVTVNALPNINAGSNQNICPGETATFTATGAAAYSWSPSTGITGSTNTASITTQPAATITYTVTGFSAAVCEATDTVVLTVFPEADVIAQSDYQICENETVQISASGAATYVWSPASSLSSSTGASTNASPDATTVYTVVGTDANGCTDTENVTVTVVQIDALILAPPFGNVPFTADISGISNGETFAWDFGNGEVATTDDVTEEFSTTYFSLETFTISLTAFLEGCSETVTTDILILSGEPFFIPDVITPNGDGLNDVFTIKGSFVREWDMVIYNRWGSEVWRMSNNFPEWAPLDEPENTYFYVFTGTNFDNTTIERQGSFTVLKD
jgi:gliding motility-associated-like protein